MELDARLYCLFDRDSFRQYEPVANTVIATGQGMVAGRRVLVIIEDVPPLGPIDTSIFSRSVQKMNRLLKEAQTAQCPVVLLIDASVRSHQKTRIPPEATRLLTSPDGVGRAYALLGQLSGRVPLVAAVLGKASATLSFHIAQSDAQVFVRQSGMCIGRPDAVATLIGEQIDYEALGGAMLHYRVTGSCDAVVDDTSQALRWVRRYLSYMPDHFATLPPATACSAEETAPLNVSWFNQDPGKPASIRAFVTSLVDPGSLLELRAGWLEELCTALARVQGRVVGIVANDASHKGGVLFPDTCHKAHRFISLCDAFNIPLVFLADTPGFMIGSRAEKAGSVKAAAQLFSTLARVRVPKMCVVTRKAHTAGLYAMAGPGFDPLQFVSLPGAAISILGKTAIRRFYTEQEGASEQRALAETMVDECDHPERLVDQGWLDAVVSPAQLRRRLAALAASLDHPVHSAEPRPIPCF